MAVKTQATAGTTSAPGPTPDVTAATEAPGPGFSSSPSTFAAFAAMASGNTLSQNGQTYFKQVGEALSSILTNDNKDPQSIRILQGGTSSSMVAVNREGSALLMLTDETMAPMAQPTNEFNRTMMVPTDHYREAMETSKSLGKIKSVAAATIISREDYHRPEVLARHIAGTLNPNPHAKSSLRELLGDRYVIEVSADDVQAIEYVNNTSIKSMVSPARVGISLNLREKSRMNDPSSVIYLGSAIGYTTFLRQRPSGPQGGDKFIPVTYITRLHDPVLRTAGMKQLLLAMFIDRFIVKDQWVRQFTSGSMSGENIGNLITDASGKPFTVTTQEQLYDFAQMYLPPNVKSIAVLSLAEWELEATLPGATRLAAINNGLLASELSTLLGGQNISWAGDALQFKGSMPVGVYGDPSGQVVDTRSITYLKAMARGGVMDESHKSMLLGLDFSREFAYWEMIKTQTMNARLLGRAGFALVNPDYINAIYRAMQPYSGLFKIGEERMFSTGYNVESFSPLAQQWASVQPPVTGGGFNVSAFSVGNLFG